MYIELVLLIKYIQELLSPGSLTHLMETRPIPALYTYIIPIVVQTAVRYGLAISSYPETSCEVIVTIRYEWFLFLKLSGGHGLNHASNVSNS